jgi:hypothetical protein
MRYIYIIGFVLFSIGFLINFLPTLLYFAFVYPDLRDSFSQRDAYLRYNLGGPGIIIDAYLQGFNITMIAGRGYIVFRPHNESCVELDVYTNVTIRKFSEINETLEEEIEPVYLKGVKACRGDPLYDFFFIPPGKTHVNISGKLYELQRCPYVYINVGARRFLLYAKDYEVYVNGEPSVTYVELATGDKILLDEFIVEDPEDPIVQLVIRALRENEKTAKFLENSTIAYTSITILLADGNVKPSLDITKRLLLDFLHTFFPVNVALMMIGVILVVLAKRRIVR